MRGVYNLTANIESVTTPKTLLWFQTPSDMVVEILSASVTNSGNATSEQLEAALLEVSTLGTPVFNVAANTKKSESGDVAMSVVASGDATTEPTTYESDPIERKGFNNLAGWYYEPVPEERVAISPSKSVGLKLLSAPTSTTFNVSIKVREIGG